MRRLMIFSAAFVLAAAGTVYFRPGPAAWAAAAAALLVIVLLKRLRGKPARAVRIALIGLSAGLVWTAGYQALFLGSAADYDEQTMPVTVTALEEASPSDYGMSVPVELVLDGRRLECMLFLREQDAQIRPGDSICVTAKLSLTPDGSEADDSFYYRARGIWFTLKARGSAEITHNGAAGIRFWPARFAAAVREKIDAVFDGEAAGFLAALLTGSRSGLSRQTRNALSIAGIYHTVAVSGMHVSILLGMVMLLCGGRRKLAAMIGIPTAALFVLMTGAPASAVRAGVMQTLLLLAPLVRRENDPPTSLAAAGLVLAAANPWAIFDTGLQLSFASVGGILLFARKLYHPLMEKKWFRAVSLPGGIRAWAAKTLASSACCSIASTAFSAYAFGTVSLIAPLCNMLTLWAVSILFTAGLVIVLLAFVWTGLAAAPAWLLGWLARYVLAAAKLCARIPCAAVYPNNIYLTAWCVLLYAALLFWLLSPVRPKLRTAVLSLSAAFLVSALCAYAQLHLPQFTITMLDVGQGQCILYQRGSFTAVVDCGGSRPWDAGEQAARYLQSFGEYRVDALVLTHYDADHAGGAVQLLEREHVRSIYLPGTQDDSGLRAEIVQKANERGCEIVWVQNDCTLDFDGGKLRIFAPLAEGSSNDSGISVLASAGEYDMLITGDMTAQTELRLVQEKLTENVELLAAGHHGARTSTSYALLGRAKPEAVLISVGKDNAYGHPSPETLTRIETAGAAVYRTDECGTITIRGPFYGKTNTTGLR